MNLRFVVEVEVERTEGKFASRDELAEQIIAELEGADPGDLEGDEGGQYTINSFDVSEDTPPRNRVAVWMTPAQAIKFSQNGNKL